MPEDEINLPKDWILVKDSISDATARKLLSKSGFRVNSAKIEYPKPGIYKDVNEAMPYVSSINIINENVSDEQAAIASLQQSDPTHFQEIAASQLELSNSYYTSIRDQSAKSFSWSRITSGVGFVFFLAAIVFLIIELGKVSYFGAAVGAVAGAFVEVYAGIIQWQGKLTANQANVYHIRLDRVQRFIIANSACESLNESEKQQMRSEIIRKFVE